VARRPKPRRFNVRLSKQKIDVSYLKDDGTVSPAKSSDLLATTPFPLLRLDRTAGFQETLDFSILAADPGLYQLEFVAHVISSGSEYELKTPPLYVVRR